MPNLLRLQWENLKKSLSDAQKHFKDDMTGHSLLRAQLIKETLDHLPRGIGDKLDEGNKLFKAGNKGRELQQKCGEIHNLLVQVQHQIQELEGKEGIGEQHIMGGVHTSLNILMPIMAEYHAKGMNVAKNHFEQG